MFFVKCVFLGGDFADFVTKSHGSADLYPTLLQNQYGYSPDAVTVTMVVANWEQ